MPNGKTHVWISLIVYFITFYLLFPQPLKYFLAGIIIMLIYSKIPDIDLDLKPFLKHRGMSHNIIGLIILTMPMWIVSYFYGIVATLSISLHLLLDSLIK